MQIISAAIMLAIPPLTLIPTIVFLLHSASKKKHGTQRKKLAAAMFAGYIQAAKIRCPHM